MAGSGVKRMIETLRSSVNTWECDENDHLNVQFYARRFDEASRHFALTARGGANAAALPPVRHIRYHGELRAPAALDIRSAVIADGPYAGHIVHLMHESQTGRLSATALDPASGLSFDATVASKEVEAAFPRGIADAIEPISNQEILAQGGMCTYRGMVWPSECDADGLMGEQHYVGRTSDAAPHAWSHCGLTQDWFDEHKCGRVALEMKICRHRPARIGDLLAIHSLMKRAGRRTLKIRHELTASSDDAALASIEVMVVILDHVRRKVAELPEPFASQPFE